MRNKFNLSRWVNQEGQLTEDGRRWLFRGSWIYLVLLCILCFIPQVPEPGMETPGVQYFGRVVVLLVPFNSFVNIGEITSWIQLVKVLVQNLANIFLLSPLVFQLLWLWPWLRKTKRVVWVSFAMSLTIECTQILLDILIDANRVFELDDLWTNTLGGYLAWLCYRVCLSRLQRERS